MNKSLIVISERKRPLWLLIIASLCFTAVIGIFILFFIYKIFNVINLKGIETLISTSIYLTGIGIGLSVESRIYIDIKNSKFRPTKEVGPIKIGRWIKIENYEYVSLFAQPLTNTGIIFNVNLWYDKNKHFTLYNEDNFDAALEIAYNLSEQLNIDLLDATIPNDFKWIDKKALKSKVIS